MLETTSQALEVPERIKTTSPAAADATGKEHPHALDVHQLNQELLQRLQQATAQVQALNQELDDFTYSISHDLRAPLRHVSGFSKLLADEFGPGLPEEAQRLLSRILHGTQRMGDMTDDLLGLARLGKHELQLQPANVGAVVQDAMADLRPECEGRNVLWKIGPLPFLKCDSELLRMAFLNLLSNALKFTRPRTQAVIEVGQRAGSGTTILFVRDNGVGFSMKYSDKLFRVFQRLHRAEDFEGTGVGLAAAERIIRKHGGRIWAESELDKGATFHFTLPEPRQPEGCAEHNALAFKRD